MKPVERIMRTAPVISVLVIENVADAVPIARALVAGGLNVLEVTLRTDAALEAIAEMTQVDGAIIGAGTVTNEARLDAAMSAGAEFIVSPGLTDNLGRAAIAAEIPFLPGIATAGDIMRGLDLGLEHFKFFPAVASRGIASLKALAGPFGGCKFCPTGGIAEDLTAAWMALPQVLCVGGSWVVPAGPVDSDLMAANARAVSQFS